MLCTLFVFISIVALAPMSAFADELEPLIEKLPEDLRNRVNEARTHVTFNWVLDVADSLEVYSREKDDDRYLMLASMIRSYNAFVNGDSALFFKNNDITLDIAERHEYYDRYFTEGINRVSFLLNSERYYSATKYSRYIVDKAKERKHPIGIFSGFHSLGNIYEKLGLFRNALLTFQEAEKSLDRMGDEFKDYRRYCRQDMAFDYFYLGNYESAERISLELIKENPKDIRSLGVLAAVYFKTGRLDKFCEYYNIVNKANVANLDNRSQAAYLYIKTNLDVLYLALEGKVDEAIKLASSRPYLESQNRKIDVYMHHNRWKDAFYCQKELNAHYDSIQALSNDNDMKEINAELENIYNVNQKERQIIALKYHVIIGLLLFLIILGLCVYFIRRNIIISKSNKVLAANLDKMLEYKEMLMKEYEINAETNKMNIAPNEDSGVDTSANVGNSLKERNVYSDVTQYIYELSSRHLYTNPDFDRNALLLELNIRRSNFFVDFERQTGMSISKYILKMRMEYAAQLIKNNPDFTLEAIASESGILSRTTFYRNFTTYFGITPSAYRNVCGQY